MNNSISVINYDNLRSGLGLGFADRALGTPSGDWIGFSIADCFSTQPGIEALGIPSSQAEGMAASAAILADLAESALSDTDIGALGDRELLDGSPIVLVALITNGAIEQTDKVKIANQGGVPSLCFGRVSVPITQEGDVFRVGSLEGMGIQSQQEKGGKGGSYWIHQTILTDKESGANYQVRFKTKDGIPDALMAAQVRSGIPIGSFLESASSGGTGNLKALTAGAAYKIKGIAASANPYKNGSPRFALDLGSFGRFWAVKGSHEFLSHFCDPETMQMGASLDELLSEGLYLRMLSIKPIDDNRSSVECDLRPEGLFDMRTVLSGDSNPPAISPAADHQQASSDTGSQPEREDTIQEEKQAPKKSSRLAGLKSVATAS